MSSESIPDVTKEPSTSTHPSPNVVKIVQSPQIRQRNQNANIRIPRIPVVQPRVTATLKRNYGHIDPAKNERPLIKLIDSLEKIEGPKKPYFPEMDEVCKEFGIPETIDIEKPNTMSSLAIADKVKMIQRLRGENKYLKEAIHRKSEQCNTKSKEIQQLRAEIRVVSQQCAVLETSISGNERQIENFREQI